MDEAALILSNNAITFRAAAEYAPTPKNAALIKHAQLFYIELKDAVQSMIDLYNEVWQPDFDSWDVAIARYYSVIRKGNQRKK